MDTSWCLLSFKFAHIFEPPSVDAIPVPDKVVTLTRSMWLADNREQVEADTSQFSMLARFSNGGTLSYLQ